MFLNPLKGFPWSIPGTFLLLAHVPYSKPTERTNGPMQKEGRTVCASEPHTHPVILQVWVRTDTKTQSPDVAFRCQRSQQKGKTERAEVGSREAAAEVGSREAAVRLIAALAADHRTEPVPRETSRIRMLRRRKQKAPLPPSPPPRTSGAEL